MPDLKVARQLFRARHLGHFGLMVQSRFAAVERNRHGKDRVTVLDRHDAARREAAAVANAVDFVDNRDLGVASQQKIAMERMRRPVGNALDGAAGSDQRLANDLAAENTLPARLRRTASKQIYLDRFEIEDGEQILYGRGHRSSQSVSIRYANVTHRQAWPSVAVTLGTKSKSIG